MASNKQMDRIAQEITESGISKVGCSGFHPNFRNNLEQKLTFEEGLWLGCRLPGNYPV